MTKNEIRQLKSHFGVRWAELRYMQKHCRHVLCMENKIILSQVLPGPVLALDCLGDVYRGILDVDTVPSRTYNTVLLINNWCFKYKTVPQLSQIIISYKHYGQRVIVNFDFAMLIFDRIKYTPQQIVDELQQLLIKHFDMHCIAIHPKITNHGFGNIFLSLDKKDV